MSKNDILENLLDSFDFKKVHEVMKSIDWIWYLDGLNEVPTIRQMELCVIDLFNGVWDEVVVKGNDEVYSQSTGGFKVKGFKTDDVIVPYAFTVSFILEESSNY